ncbi:hypothetical protein [Brevibacterium aurantiacum]|uniref:Uncharacterized protein n=1 Tax=Brevibacterium aurantiacum TaxID=273384 RepID=A0A4Z0KLV7_BREAU|nr:hypothetical protein [Brevibacterium aurantiacum]TGD38676.1 hypothetical protein EB834_10940 [Brevibacterium aurantiacum]
MTTAYRHRKALTYSALILVATGLPFAIPFSATLLGWALEVPMRLAFSESMLATLGVFLAWFVISRLIDVILDGSDIGGTLTGRLVSAGASMVLQGGGYFLIVDSALASLLMAVTVCGLLFALSFAIDRGIGASHVR